MVRGIVDLSLAVEDKMTAHKLFPSPIYLKALSPEATRAICFGVEGDPMTFQTNCIGMLDHVGTHVDALVHVNPNDAPIDEMPLDLFMGKSVCLDLGTSTIWRASPPTTGRPPRRRRASRWTATSSSCAPVFTNATGATASRWCGATPASPCKPRTG